MSTVQDSSSVTSLFGATAATASKSSAEETQDRFLKLLVAQMKNQDPLNPLDNAQVTSQMAQLSTVQGIESMKASMETLVASLSSNQMAQASNLIGRGVLVPGNHIGPAADSAVVGFDLDGTAGSVKLTIENAAGVTVRTLDLGARAAGVNVVAWDGLADDGSAAPEGDYIFKVSATQGSTPVTSEALYLAMVNSVSQNSQGVTLNLSGNGKASYADIRQIF
ncbi:MAG: flagellar hook assembly protein FlgD [Pseudomonadota bacterium]